MPPFERSVPDVAWGRALVVAGVLTVMALVGWEAKMRALGLHAGDLGDGVDHWTDERRKVDTERPDGIVLLGSSRILFDTDLDEFEKIVRARPIQLALPGTPGPAFLSDIADDERFTGLAIMDMTETLYFSGRLGLCGKAVEHAKTQSPSRRSGHVLHQQVSRVFAFLDENYSLFSLLERIDVPNRGTIEGPYMDVWKLSESGEGRQTAMWERIETDVRLRDHARAVWHDFKGEPLGADIVGKTIDRARRDVEKIRSRGGEVVFLRAPSGGPIRDNERIRAPRDKVWERLLRETKSFGIHFEDHPDMLGLDIPEWSHLSRESAKRFTRAYATVLARDVEWLRAHPR